MTGKKDALKQFFTFMAQKYRQELSDECPPSAPRILNKISENNLATAFGYHDCPEWTRYIIDLDKELAPEAFSHENPLYCHTLRIFKAGKDNPVFGIEKPKRTHEAIPEFRGAARQAISFARRQGIVLKYRKTTADDIFFILENGQLKVKFAYFSLLPDGGSADG